MKRMAILLVLSLALSLTVRPPGPAWSEPCTYSTTELWEQYGGCYCDLEETHKCASSGYVEYVYTCDGHGDCSPCETCHYVGTTYGWVMDRLFAVCHSIDALAPMCDAVMDCEVESWHADWIRELNCQCW